MSEINYKRMYIRVRVSDCNSTSIGFLEIALGSGPLPCGTHDEMGSAVAIVIPC